MILPFAVVIAIIATVRSGVIQTDRPFGDGHRNYAPVPIRQAPPANWPRSGAPGPAFMPADDDRR